MFESLKKIFEPPKVLAFYHIEGIKFLNQNEPVNVEVFEDSIKIYQKKDNILLTIENDKIDNVQMLQEYESTQENKSVIGRAIVGGLLLGPIGAGIGAISGVGTKTKTNVQYYLEITSGENKIILAPFFNSEKISNTIKDMIIKNKGI